MNVYLRTVLFLSLCVSFSTMAETGLETCRDISFSSDREKCFEALVGNYFDEDAGFVCSRARFNSGRLECVQASVNREYTRGEAEQCDDESFDDDRVECMQRLGRRSLGMNQRMARIQTLAQQAYAAASQGNLYATQEFLMSILRLSRRGRGDQN